MTLRVIPRPKDQSWRLDWFLWICDTCLTRKPVVLPLPPCAQCERRERFCR